MYRDKDNKREVSISKICLDLMEEALYKISPYYVREYEYDHGDGEKDIYDQVERCFAYELYHQLRQITEYDSRFNDDIVINAEIPKQGYPSIESKKKTQGRVFPDIVIHGGQECQYKNKQLLVCEIKRNSNIGKIITTIEDIKNDLA